MKLVLIVSFRTIMCFNFFFLITLGSYFAKKAKYWLERSEWTDVITNPKIRTSGSSEAILSATHKKKTRYVHQVNVAVLYSMLKESFDDSGYIDFEEWIDIHRKKVTTFRILAHIARTRMSYADVCA